MFISYNIINAGFVLLRFFNFIEINITVSNTGIGSGGDGSFINSDRDSNTFLSKFLSEKENLTLSN